MFYYLFASFDARQKVGQNEQKTKKDSKSNAEVLPAANEGGTRGGSEQHQAKTAQQKPEQSNSENSAPDGPRELTAGNEGGGSSAREQNRPGPIAAQPQKQGASNASSAPPFEAQSLGKQDEQPHVDKVEAGGTSTWTIVGSILGAIGAAGIIMWIVISCVKRCRKRTNKKCTTEEEEKPKSAEVPPESQQTTTTSSSRRTWGLRGFSYTSPEYPKNGLFPVFSMAGMGNGTHHQAEKGEHQAEKREHQAEKREHQAEKREHQAEKREHQAEKREHQAEKREHQAEKREHQAEKREHQAEKREHQAEKGERNEQPTAPVNAVPQQQQQAAQQPTAPVNAVPQQQQQAAQVATDGTGQCRATAAATGGTETGTAELPLSGAGGGTDAEGQRSAENETL
ncbi:hypothetical protein niasHT_034121 [Heterodera trifolii]|uniref:Uncharacterized protein n=1 Tax=Heterodera trifolii TaxID=157864 RepID=A0ABD2J2W5_9BILA